MENIISSEKQKTSPKSISLVIAENGTITEHQLSKFMPSVGLKKGSALMDYIAQEYGVQKDQQVILRAEDGKQLDPNTPLEEYFEKERVIYVYNKVFYKQEQIPDDFEVIGPLSLEKKVSESARLQLAMLYEDHYGQNLKDIIDSENNLKFEDMMVIFGDTRNEINALKEGTIKLTRQKDSETVAKKNLMNYFNDKKSNFDKTINELERDMEKFSQQLQNFEPNITLLRETEISQIFQEEEKKHLIDYFDISKISRSKENYEKNQMKITEKITEIKSEISDYEKKLKNINENMNVEAKDIQKRIQGFEEDLIHIQDISLQELKNLMQDSKKRPTKLEVNEFVKKQSDSVVPKLNTIAINVDKIRDEIEKNLKENANHLKSYIADIATLQQGIKSKLHNKLTIISSLVEKHRQDMFNVDIIEKFPDIHRHSIVEIERRQAFRKDYSICLSILENMGDQENKCREEFIRSFGQYLPKTFCPVLTKHFRQLNFKNIRDNLNMDIGIETVENLHLARSTNNSDEISDFLRKIDQVQREKDQRIQYLEENLKIKEKENTKLATGQLTVQNIRLLFGKIDFDYSLEQMVLQSKKMIEERFAKLNQRVKTVENIKTKMSQSISKCSKISQTEVDKIKEMLNQEISKQKEASQQILNMKQDNQQLMRICEGYKQQIEDLKMAEQQLKLKQGNVEAESRAKFLLIEELKVKIAENESNLQSLTRHMEKDKETFAAENKKSSQRFADLRNERDSAIAEKEKVEACLIEERLAKNELQSKLEKLQAAQSQVTELNASISNIKQERENVYKELSTKIQQLESKLAETEKARTELANQLNVTQTQNSEYKKQLEQRGDEIRDLSIKVENGLKEKNSLIAQKDEVLQQEKEEKQKLTKIVDELQKSIKMLQENPNDAKSAMEISLLQFEKDKLLFELTNQRFKAEELENELNKSLIAADNGKGIEGILQYVGENIVEMYKQFVPGKASLIQQRETDVADMLTEVKKAIETQFIKIQDLHIGDKVIAVRFKNLDDKDKEKTHEVIHINEWSERVIYITKIEKYISNNYSKARAFGDAVIGKVKTLNVIPSSADKRFKDASVVEVTLDNLTDIRCVFNSQYNMFIKFQQSLMG